MTCTDVQPWTVSALTQLLKTTLEGAFPNVSVQGEISNCKLQPSGHLYFTLKDAQAQINAVMFRAADGLLNFDPQNGDLVIVEGSMNVYPAGGRYQITVKRMQKQGLGELLLLLEERKRSIAKRGWFRPEHKKKLPFAPKRIGVVTSASGAVIRDIIQILCRRAKNFHLILNPVKVQGEGAAEEIAAAVDFFNAHQLVDVILVGRGGGSFEDLWPFNAEVVAEAIFNSHIPVICAVGHETDHCIAEYVADVRAPTPSAAAEMITVEQQQLLLRLKQLEEQCTRALMQRLHLHMQRLDDIAQELHRAITHRLRHFATLLDGRRRQARAHNPIAQLQQRKIRLDDYRKNIDQAVERLLRRRHERLEALQRTLKAIDPTHLLNKGFSILFAEKERSVITSVTSVSVGDVVRVRLAGGYLQATIDQVILDASTPS